MATKIPPGEMAANATARDEIFRRRPDLKGKSLEAMRRILRRETRLTLKPRRSVNPKSPA